MKIRDYDYITSSLGNAYFSGVTFDQLWDCVTISQNPEQLDIAIETTIKLKELIDDRSKK